MSARHRTAENIDGRQPPRTCAEARAALDAEFKVGDVVWLKSGGQPMTVVGIDCPMVEVAWFGRFGDLQTSDFRPSCLATEEPSFAELPF
jgi:uncharacterized protein YodC (DUF2158 family)